MTLLASLVEASERVAASSSRLAKVRELAAFLQSLEPAEMKIGVQYLSGEAPQGRVGIGQAVLREASTARPANAATLSITEVDRTIAEVAALRGAGVNSLRIGGASRPVRSRDGRRATVSQSA